jgi:hypothetical protein
LDCLALQASKFNRPDTAFEIMKFLMSKRLTNLYGLLTAYEYKEKADGKESALGWLRKEVSNDDGSFSFVAYDSVESDLLWDVASADPKSPFFENVWLLRAAKSLKSGEMPAHKKELMEHYSRTRPDLAGYQAGNYSRPHALVLGQFLMDMITPEQLLAASRDNRLMCDTAYFIAIKAEAAGDLESACQWYRVATETQQTENSTYYWAFETLLGWRNSMRKFEHNRQLKRG